MTDRTRNEVLAWCPDQATFHRVMQRVTLPNGQPLAWKADVPTGALRRNGQPKTARQLVFIEGLDVDEIGPLVIEEAVFDDNLDSDGNARLIKPAVIAEGHHVNIVMSGTLAEMINENRPKDLPLAEWLMQSGLVAGLQKVAKDKPKRKPGGREGTSKMRIYDPSEINTRRRVFA